MFWCVSQVKHLLSINETGVLHHLVACTHKHREAGCDSKTSRQLRENICMWERGDLPHGFTITFPSVGVAKQQNSLRAGYED